MWVMSHRLWRRAFLSFGVFALYSCASRESAVEHWSQLLTRGTPEEQRAAVDSLAAIGPEASGSLPALFSTPFPPDGNPMDLASRMLAVEQILSSDDDKAMAAVALTLREGSGIRVRLGTVERDAGIIMASNALAKKGARAVPLLRDALSSANPEVRKAAARALGDIGPAAAAALPQLEAMETTATDSAVHETVTKAISNIRGNQ